MHFVWFWTFWHWSKEGFRRGSLLRKPLHGIGSHWDEWFRHEACASDLQAIEEAGKTQSTQRKFIAWMIRCWARENDWPTPDMVSRFVVGQLASVPPFDKWQALESYRTSYGLTGVSAIVLEAESAGNAADVRPVQALLLPADGASEIVPDGFQAGSNELETVRRAARSLLRGKGLLIFLALWATGGHRPYSRRLRLGLGLAWLALIGSILFLVLGPEPGEWLIPWSATMLALWSGLVLLAVTVAAWQGVRAWRQGISWSRLLERSQVRMRMPGGLTLQGESAGLPFCLNTLLALGRAPRSTRPSWLWQRVIQGLRSEAETWAATGVVTAAGYLKPVVLEAKLRACLNHPGIQDVLTPHQRDGGQPAVDRIADAIASRAGLDAPMTPFVSGTRFGFAAEKRALRNHACRHAAGSLMVFGKLADKWQVGANIVALITSMIMVMALPDLRSILLPHPAPVAVEPGSPSPYDLWVSLDTDHPEYFSAVLESSYWSNRRAEVRRSGGVIPSVRAEIHLHRLVGRAAANDENGTIWIERRRRFLNREYLPGERVGRYSIAYLTHIGRE
jgi:hypothetical protein